MDEKLKEAVSDARKRRLSGQEKPSTFVSGDTEAGIIREGAVEKDEPKADDKPKE